MTQHSALEQLMGRARGPMGPAIELDFGVAGGPLVELGQVISRMNGFFLFNGGIQVFRVGEEGLGPDMLAWNTDTLWKSTYAGLADDLFCFGQDLFGTQFAILGDEEVVRFDPETATVKPLGASLEDWARWLLSDPDVNGVNSFAHAFQKEHGALEPDERLIPLQFFVTGGSYDFDNLSVKDAAVAMQIRGPIAQKIHNAPEGATIRLGTE
ncbi:SMI1/KNR4 family protein [Streptomyces sioyaensis]|uniref:SMI1/KNR4 family protein n=1 Tax=Streptomyces sioyaensis TaxID=67364 RepID=A0A4Q1RAV8_9ACTN|nr:SMI1/KNR4 family protein [Streptomyces sioyaensis]MBM4793496.1 SMI1/KNR4 family protein [Streptomyces sioyaensis]RXS70615.1 SMI1/KNR4 family protein [Streptomyces sioyaensis]